MDDLLAMAEAGLLLKDDGGAATNSAGASGGKAWLHPRWSTMTPGQARRHLGTSGHCSALIKVRAGGGLPGRACGSLLFPRGSGGQVVRAHAARRAPRHRMPASVCKGTLSLPLETWRVAVRRRGCHDDATSPTHLRTRTQQVTSDLSDILIGHTTWWSYTSLLRLYKHYVFALAHPAVAAQRLSFSSYPGLVHSLDDFMIASSGLVIVETSNDIYDLNLYKLSTNKVRVPCVIGGFRGGGRKGAGVEGAAAPAQGTGGWPRRFGGVMCACVRVSAGGAELAAVPRRHHDGARRRQLGQGHWGFQLGHLQQSIHGKRHARWWPCFLRCCEGPCASRRVRAPATNVRIRDVDSWRQRDDEARVVA